MLNWDWDDYCPNYRRFGIWLVARRPIPTYVQRNLTRTSSTMILDLHMSRCSCTQNITWEYLFQLRCFFFCLTLAVWYLSHLSIYQFIYLSTNLPIYFPTYFQNKSPHLHVQTTPEQWKFFKQKWVKTSHKPTIRPPYPKSVGFQPCGTQRLRHPKKNKKQPWISPRSSPTSSFSSMGTEKLSKKSVTWNWASEVAKNVVWPSKRSMAARPLILWGHFIYFFFLCAIFFTNPKNACFFFGKQPQN